MKEKDKQFILELIKKETLALTIALETKIIDNLKREMNQFKIHLQFRINQKLMNINSFKSFKNIYQWNFLNTSMNFKRLAYAIKSQLKYNFNL